MEWTRKARYTALDATTQPQFAALCAQAANSVWRQGFHVQPLAGLLNDPNGFCWHRGAFHLFYQWFPLGPVHGLKYWYHVSTADFVHYRQHGIAIAPDSVADSHGAYSGSALSTDAGLRIAYTGNHRTADWQRIPYQIMATLPDHGALSKDAPFLQGPPAGYTEHVRDPKIWREADGSYAMVLGAQRDNHTGAALYLTSVDTREWQLQGEIDCALPDFGYMWECPDYFALNGQDVLLFCPQGLPAQDGRFANIFQSGYIAGRFDRHTRRFTHGGFFELDHGFDFYAPQTCTGEQGERVLIGWMGLPDMSCPSDRDGWAHCLTVPRVLTWENAALRQRPWPGLQALRGEGAHDGVHFELLLNNPESEPFSLTLRQSAQEETRLYYDGTALVLDRSRSGFLPEPEIAAPGKGGHVRRLSLAKLTQLHVFSDTSSLEIFINDGEAVMSARIFPATAADALETAIGSQAILTLYPLKEAIWRSMPLAKP